MSLFAQKSSDNDDDPAARAYEAISSQLQQWGEPLNDDDADDDDALMEEDEDITFRLVSRSSFESPLPTSDSVMATPSSIRTPYASKTPLSILRSNYKGGSPIATPASRKWASPAGLSTPGNVSTIEMENQEDMMNEDRDANFYNDYLTYHDATSKWLLQQEHDWMVSSCGNKWENSIWNLMSVLMQTMHHLDLPTNSSHDVQQYMQRLVSTEKEDFLTAWYDKLDTYEEQNLLTVVSAAAEEKQKDDIILPPCSLVRRQLILDWLETTAQEFDPSSLRKSSAHNSVMWADSVQYLNRYPSNTSSGKIQMIDPDAKGELYGQDEATDQKLLQSCWKYLRSGQWTRAMDACRDANQFWRCVAYNGVASHYDTDNKELKKDAYALSKRRAWQSSSSMAKSNRPSVQYESAIFAIWANHTKSLLQNPIIFQNDDKSNVSRFLTLLWVHYRAMSERCMEELHHQYYSSTRRKRDNFYTQQKQIDQLLHDQLQATEDISRWQEIDIITNVFSQINHETNEEENTFLSAISAILQGTLESWVKSNIEKLSHQSAQTDEAHLKIVRFVVHVLLFLRVHVQNSMTLIDDKETFFLSSYIENHLIGNSNLWSYVTLYSILLPAEECWGVLLEFWKEVSDPEIQNMLVQQAKEYLPRIHKGEDIGHILLVQAVVREILNFKNNQMTENDAFSESTWFTLLPPTSPEKQRLSPIEHKLEQSIDQMDIRKMQSLSWFDYLSTTEDDDIQDDDGDRWVCTNILLRQFLLQTCTLTAETMTNINNDWIRNFLEKDVKLYTAGVFLDRYLPAKDDTKCDNDTLWEFEAITSYVQSQNDFISWNHTLLEYDPVVQRKSFSSSGSKLENEIAAKMDRKTYCDSKRNVAKVIISAALKASESLSNVLTYRGGWLFADEGAIIEDEKREQWQALRNKCLPHAVNLLSYVFKKTAVWMQIFVKDIEASFGKDEAKRILSQISMSSHDGSLMEPVSWFRMSLDVATIIASNEHSILDCLSPEVLEIIMADMADTGVEILACTQDE